MSSPDCRAYELVSLSFTNGLILGGFLVSADGSSVGYKSLGLVDETGLGETSAGTFYSATRNPMGWTTEALQPSASGFSDEVSQGANIEFYNGAVDETFVALRPQGAIAPNDHLYRVASGSRVVEVGPLAPPSELAAWSASQGVPNFVPLGATPDHAVCLVAANPAEPGEATQGNTIKFTTLPSKPLILEENSGETTAVAETLRGTVNTENQTNACIIEDGETIGYGKTARCLQELTNADTASDSARIKGLHQATVYHYRLVIKDPTGTTEGPDQTIETPTAEKAAVLGESVSGVSATDAAFEAKINPNYQETTHSFECSTSEQAILDGKGTPVAGSPPAAALPADFDELLAGAELCRGHLTPGTTYYYRALATNETGTSEGAVKTSRLPRSTAHRRHGGRHHLQQRDRHGELEPGWSGHNLPSSLHHPSGVRRRPQERPVRPSENQPADSRSTSRRH